MGMLQWFGMLLRLIGRVMSECSLWVHVYWSRVLCACTMSWSGQRYLVRFHAAPTERGSSLHASISVHLCALTDFSSLSPGFPRSVLSFCR